MHPAATITKVKRTTTPRWALALAVCVTTVVCLSVLAAASVVGESLVRPGKVSLTGCNDSRRTANSRAHQPHPQKALPAPLTIVRQAGMFTATTRIEPQRHSLPHSSFHATFKQKKSLPTVNELFIQTNGYTRISGRCEPDRPISVLLDGKLTTTAQCSNTGVYHTLLTDALTTGEHVLKTAHNSGNTAEPSTAGIRIYIPPGYWDNEDDTFLVPPSEPENPGEPIAQDVIDYAEELSAAASQRFDELMPADGAQDDATGTNGANETNRVTPPARAPNKSAPAKKQAITQATQHERNAATARRDEPTQQPRTSTSATPQRIGTCPWIFAVAKSSWRTFSSWLNSAQTAYMAHVVPRLRAHDTLDPYEPGPRMTWFQDVPLPERREATRGFEPVNIDTAQYVDRVQEWFARSYRRYRDEIVIALGDGDQPVKPTTARPVATPTSDRLASRDQIESDSKKMEREAQRIARLQRNMQRREREAARQQQIERQRLASLEHERTQRTLRNARRAPDQQPPSEPTKSDKKPAKAVTQPAPARPRVAPPENPPTPTARAKPERNIEQIPPPVRPTAKAKRTVPNPTKRPVVVTGTTRPIPLPSKRPPATNRKQAKPVHVAAKKRPSRPARDFDGRSSLGASGVATQKSSRIITRIMPLPVMKPRDIALLYVKKRKTPSAVAPEKRKRVRKTSRKKRARKKKKRRRYGRTYVVRKGDTLWRIARRVYGRGELYTAIVRKNRGRLTNPDKIRPGLRLTLPRRKTK